MDQDTFQISISAVGGVFLLLFIILFAIVINLHFKVKAMQNDDESEHEVEISRPQIKYGPGKHDDLRPEPEIIPKPSLIPRNTHQYQSEPTANQQPASQSMPNDYRRSASNDSKADDFNNRWRVERQTSDLNSLNTPPLRDNAFRNPMGGPNRKEGDNRFNYTDPRSLERLNRPNTDIGFRGMQQQNSRPRESPQGNNFSMEPAYPRRDLHY